MLALIHQRIRGLIICIATELHAFYCYSLNRKTGVLCYGRSTIPNERDAMSSTERALKSVQCDFEKLNANELKQRYKGK